MTQRFGGSGVISLLGAAMILGLLWQFGVAGGGGSGPASQPAQQIARAQDATGEVNLTAVTPAIQAYFAEHGTYEGMGDPAQGLLHYDASATGIVVASATSTSYCIETTSGTQTFSERGPGGAPSPGPC